MDILPYHCMFSMAFQSDSCSRLREDVSLLDLNCCNNNTTQVLCDVLDRYGAAVATSTPNCSRTSHNRAVDDSGINDSFVCDTDKLNLSDLCLTDDVLLPLPKRCLSSEFDEVDDEWVDCCYLMSDQPVKPVCGFGENDSIRSDDSFDLSAVEDSVDINISLLFVDDSGSSPSANKRLSSSRRPRSPAPRIERRSRHRLSLDLYRESHSELGIFSDSESVFADDSISDLQQLSCLTDSGISVSEDDGSICSNYHSVDNLIQYTLNNFAPPQLNQLIGRKMGLQTVDIIAELSDRSMYVVTNNIFRCLSAAELCSVCMVSRVWQSAVESNTHAVARRHHHVSQLQKKLDSSEQNSEASNATIERHRRVLSASVSSPLTDIHLQLNCVKISPVTKSHECSKTERFWQEASNLRNNERLLKCPRCSGPCRVDPVQERAVCVSSNCQHDCCINCLSNFHGSQKCASAKLSITARRSFPLVGSRQSHQNLRRL